MVRVRWIPPFNPPHQSSPGVSRTFTAEEEANPEGAATGTMYLSVSGTAAAMEREDDT